jgi:hypothetical protein
MLTRLPPGPPAWPWERRCQAHGGRSQGRGPASEPGCYDKDMIERRPSAIVMFSLCGIVLFSVLAVLVFLPIWHCPWCDSAMWEKIYPSIRFRPAMDTSTCEHCNATGKMNLYRRWQAIRGLGKANLYQIPIFH